MSENDMEKTGFTLDGRVMCSDETCIGIVAEDGKCKECGRVYEGTGRPFEEAGSKEPGDPFSNDSLNGEAQSDCSDLGGVDSIADRRCCSDDSCIGIIGDNGRCGICGKPA